MELFSSAPLPAALGARPVEETEAPQAHQLNIGIVVTFFIGQAQNRNVPARIGPLMWTSKPNLPSLPVILKLRLR